MSMHADQQCKQHEQQKISNNKKEFEMKVRNEESWRAIIYTKNKQHLKPKGVQK